MDGQLLLLAQEARGGAGGAIGGLFCMVIWLALIVGIVAGCWKVFVKAGQPGWGILIPFYNAYLMVKIANRPDWWFLLLFIPVVGMIIGIILTIDIATNFGKGVGFALGMIFLGFIFWPLLGFSDAQYNPVQRP